MLCVSEYNFKENMNSNTSKILLDIFLIVFFIYLIAIPIGLMQDHIFNEARPKFLNYASFGSIIAYTMSSAFSFTSHLRDKYGNSVNWWQPDTLEEYLNRTKCLQNELITNLDTITTDLLSIKTSYLAYKDWAKRHYDELSLPFLKLNANQLFWVVTAQNHCDRGKGNNILLMQFFIMQIDER